MDMTQVTRLSSVMAEKNRSGAWLVENKVKDGSGGGRKLGKIKTGPAPLISDIRLLPPFSCSLSALMHAHGTHLPSVVSRLPDLSHGPPLPAF
jgi:hypothetical protein